MSNDSRRFGVFDGPQGGSLRGCPQRARERSPVPPNSPIVDSMNPTRAYLVALGEARSCLAALADSTDDVDLSIHYDHLLIELDGITDDIGPAARR